MVSDTFSFVKELINSNFSSDNLIMASFDIKCLFTNIPPDETVDNITIRLFRNAIHFHNFYLDQFTKLLRYPVKICYFWVFPWVYPLALIWLIFFFHSTKIHGYKIAFVVSNQLTIVGMSMTAFLLFLSAKHINFFLNFLNQQRANIKFTSECETPNKTLSFLDIQIKRNNWSFSTSAYQKPTFPGLFTDFHSFMPLKYKKGLIQTHIDRFFKSLLNLRKFSFFSLTAILLIFWINAFNYF